MGTCTIQQELQKWSTKTAKDSANVAPRTMLGLRAALQNSHAERLSRRRQEEIAPGKMSSKRFGVMLMHPTLVFVDDGSHSVKQSIAARYYR
eukprot:m.167261 g.167261  ORF g.167261 m.167261 type:complete len:92 (-) comp18191_c0_seq1:28-303(-)